MPLLKIQATEHVAGPQQAKLVAAASRLLAEATGKPEKYVMVTLDPAVILMAGQPGPAAFLDVRGIGGLTPEVNRRVSQQLCQLLKDALGVPAERVYITFTDVPATNWGWNGATFG
jgi:phenylpyruvate tautomerase